jgi:anti-repressor protein
MEKSEIKIFENPEFGAVRTMKIDDIVWFVGKDVAKILGYSNSRKALIDHVDEEDKTDGVTIRDSIGREQNPVCINESGLYSLILSSKLPSAKKFKHWVTSEVLPSIRKHGAYMTDETFEQALQDPDKLIRILTNLKNERAKRKELESKIESDRPKVNFANAVVGSDSVISIGGLAKLLRQKGVDTGQNRLFRWMRDNGYLIKTGSDRNDPKQKYLDMGLFEIKKYALKNQDKPYMIKKTTKVTGKGQKYFINKILKEKSEENK